jgi:hypothetical protein
MTVLRDVGLGGIGLTEIVAHQRRTIAKAPGIGRRLDLYVRRMEQLLRDCQTELREMDLLEQWRRDEARDRQLQDRHEHALGGAAGSFIPLADL